MAYIASTLTASSSPSASIVKKESSVKHEVIQITSDDGNTSSKDRKKTQKPKTSSRQDRTPPATSSSPEVAQCRKRPLSNLSAPYFYGSKSRASTASQPERTQRQTFRNHPSNTTSRKTDSETSHVSSTTKRNERQPEVLPQSTTSAKSNIESSSRVEKLNIDTERRTGQISSTTLPARVQASFSNQTPFASRTMPSRNFGDRVSDGSSSDSSIETQSIRSLGMADLPPNDYVAEEEEEEEVDMQGELDAPKFWEDNIILVPGIKVWTRVPEHPGAPWWPGRVSFQCSPL